MTGGALGSSPVRLAAPGNQIQVVLSSVELDLQSIPFRDDGL